MNYFLFLCMKVLQVINIILSNNYNKVFQIQNLAITIVTFGMKSKLNGINTMTVQ